MKNLLKLIAHILSPIHNRCEQPDCLRPRELADMPAWHERPTASRQTCATC